MESVSNLTVKISIAGAEDKILDSIPLSYAELIRPIIIETPGITKMDVTWNGNLIKDTEELFKAYLNNKQDEFHLVIDIEEKAMSYVDTAVSGQYTDMLNKFQKMATQSTEEAKVEAPTTIPNVNGFPTKEGLIALVREMTNLASQSVVENSRRFMVLRQQFYQVDMEKYKAIVVRQLQINDALIIHITQQTCQKFGIAPEAFEGSCQAHGKDPEVKAALERLGYSQLTIQGPVPEALTAPKLSEILNSACDFTEEYLKEHPMLHPMEVVMVKMMEADQIKKEFDFDELEVSAAITKYNLEENPELMQIRTRMDGVTKQLLAAENAFRQQVQAQAETKPQ